MADKPISIVYLDKNRFDFHGGAVAGTATCVFPAEVVFDMEVKHRPAFRSHIQSFLSVNKISPSKILVILSPPLCFEKLHTPQVQLDANIADKNFIETVPFEQVAIRTYKTQKGLLTICTNATLIEALKTELSSFGHFILAVVPATMLGIQHNQTGLDVKTAQTLSENALSSVALDITTEAAKMETPVRKKTPLESIAANRRLIILLSVFLVLIIILILVLKNAAFI